MALRRPPHPLHRHMELMLTLIMPTHIGAETDLRFVYCAGGWTFCAVAALCLMGFIQVDLASNLQESASIDICLLLEWCVQLFSQQGVDAWRARRQGSSRDCRFDRLQASQPVRNVRSEAGVTEYFDETRKGYAGLSFPGCPATHQQQFQPFDQTQSSQDQKFRDEHQKIHQLRQGDVIALPAGVAHWFYNSGDTPVVIVYVYDVNNNANQLEPRQKEFLLAGNSQSQSERHMFERSTVQHSGKNVFCGFNAELLSEALGISREAARRLQSENDQRGEIIRVKRGLQLLKPTSTQQQQQQEQEQGQYQQVQYREQGQYNGLEENMCSVKARANIDNPNRADYYNPRAGRITHLNSQKLQILNLVQMSATRVNLYQVRGSKMLPLGGATGKYGVKVGRWERRHIE
ncbi:hypothetical protein ABZP36_020079 [Zizania latifolia]